MKKFTKVLATLMMLMMLIIPMASAISINDFTDFPHDAWSTEALTAAVDNDLLIGNGNGLIEPDRPIKRGELVAFVTRAFGATITADISRFTDVNPGDWYYKPIALGCQMGAVCGTSSTTFEPEKNITREEVFTVLARILCIESTNATVLDKFSDKAQISDWAVNYIAGLVENGYIDGYPNGTMAPGADMTRAELSQLFHNIFKTYIDTPGYHTAVAPKGSVIVRTAGAHLENVVINGDLVIADGVGAGNFDANTVNVNGRILARGGEGTVTFKKVTATDKVVIFDRNGTVNFHNYRTDVPFKDNLIEYTPAKFLTKTPVVSDDTDRPSSPGGSSTTRYNVYFYNGDDLFDTVSVKSGNCVAKPRTDPTKAGYTFVYWSEDKNDDGTGTGFDFTTAIRSKKNLYAIFVKDAVTYDITFDLGNGTTKVVTIDEGEKIAESDVPTLPDTATQYFRGWTTPGGINIPLDAVKDYEFTEDTLLTPWFVDKNKMIVTFYNGTQPFATQEIPEGGNAAAPATDPTKTGAEFKHWGTSDDAETAFDFNTAINTDTKLYAVYEYTVSFDGNAYPVQKVLHGKTATNPGNGADVTGKTFKHWSLTPDGDAYDFATKVTDSITLYPVYSINKYNVEFVGETPFEVEHGNTIPAGNIPAKADTATQYFKGWTATYDDGSASQNILSEDMDEYTVTKDVTFTPWFVDKDKKVVTFYNGTATFETQEIPEGGNAAAPATDPTKTGAEFKHWGASDDAETAFDFNTAINTDTKLYAVYEYTVSFDGNAYPAQKILHGKTATNPGDASETGKTFKHWSATPDGAAYDFSTKVTDSITLYPVFDINVYEVNFVVNGSTVDTKNVEHGNTVDEPADPAAPAGKKFAHWSLTEDGAAYDFATAVTESFDLYAVFTDIPVTKYTVKFIVEGNTVSTEEVVEGETVTKPADPTAPAGKKFAHWSLTEDGAAYDFATAVTESFDLYAVFTDIPVTKYTVTFIVEGNTVSTEEVVEGETVTKPADPTAPTGMKFVHWSTTLDGAEYDFTTPVNSKLDLYAVFVPVTDEKFDVIFKVDGSEVHSEEVTDGGYAQGPATAPEDKEEFYFAGWIVEGDTTETVVDLTTYAITEDTTFVALYKEKMVVTFYDLSFDDAPLHTAYVVPGETLADNQYPHHEDNYGESILDYGTPGYVKNDSIHSVYSGVNFVHNIPMSYWYLVNDADTEWTEFDSTVVINEDTDVHINIKQFNVMLDVPQISDTFSLVLWANYGEDTRAIDTLKDILFINENTINKAYGTVEDKLLEKAVDKGIIDEDKNILNINKRITLVQILGEDRIENYIWEFAGDSIDTTEVAEWIKNNYLDKYPTLAPEKKEELVNSFILLFDTIIADDKITDTEIAKVSEIVQDFFMTMSEEDIDDLINHYLCNRLKEGDTEHVKELIVSMLKAFKNVDEDGLKDVVADFIASQLGENDEITDLVTDYIKDEVKNGNYGDTLVDYIKEMVDDSNANAASNKATITSIVKDVAATNFEVVEDAISDKLDTDDSFANTVVNTAIDAENAAFRAVINEAIVDATGVSAGVVEAMTTTEIKNAFNDAADAGDLDGSMDDIVAAALTLMKNNAAVRNTAIDAYIESVGVAALAENLVDTLQNNKSLFKDEDVAKVLDNAVDAQLDIIDEDSQMITDYVDSLVTNNKFDAFANAFVKITDESTRHDIVNSIIHEILLSTSAREALRSVIDELVDEMFEMGHIDREFIEYFLAHMGEEANEEAFNDFMELLDEIVHNGEQLNNIAAILGHESSSKQTAYVNQLIDELCAGELNNVTVTEDRIFMFEPILEKIEQFDYEFVESKVPDKLKQVLPMDTIEELFTRFYDDAKYGYVASMRKAIADVTGHPDKTVYIDSGVTIMLNPVSDLFTPALEHAVEMKGLADGKLSDKFPTYYEYYKENPYAAALEDYLTTQTWFDGSDEGFEGTYSGYSLKEFNEYYDITQALAVLTDDAILYYYNEVPVSDRDKVLDVALTKLLEFANIGNNLLVDYAINGVPASLEDFVKSLEDDPDLLKYIDKFGVGAYLDKISGNANADKVYDTAFDRIMDKAGTRIEALLNKYVESKLNREYDEEEHQKVLEILKGMFTTVEGEDVYTIDTIFDDYLDGVDSKKISKKNITAEVERNFLTSVDDAK